MRITWRVLLLLAAALALPACHPVTSETTGTVDPAVAAQLEQGLSDVVHTLTTPGALLGVRIAGQGTWTGAAGLNTGSVAMRPDQLFRIGSVTKTFTAAAILQLAQEGVLTLDDPLASWAPGLVPNDGAITIGHLLSHRSGLYNYTSAPELTADINREWTPQELVAMSASRPPLFAPGTAFSYCNTGYILAGIILQNATGLTWEDVIQSRFLTPLGLAETSLDIASPLPERMAHGYYWDAAAARYIDVTGINGAWAWAAGSMVSSARDLLRWSEALHGGEVLSPAWHGVMATQLSLLYPELGVGYGYGLMLRSSPVWWGHGGNFVGYRCMLGFMPERGVHVVALVNSSAADPDLVAEVGWDATGGGYYP